MDDKLALVYLAIGYLICLFTGFCFSAVNMVMDYCHRRFFYRRKDKKHIDDVSDK